MGFWRYRSMDSSSSLWQTNALLDWTLEASLELFEDLGLDPWWSQVTRHSRHPTLPRGLRHSLTQYSLIWMLNLASFEVLTSSKFRTYGPVWKTYACLWAIMDSSVCHQIGIKEFLSSPSVLIGKWCTRYSTYRRIDRTFSPIEQFLEVYNSWSQHGLINFFLILIRCQHICLLSLRLFVSCTRSFQISEDAFPSHSFLYSSCSQI